MNPQFISALQNVILILQCITLVASVIALIIALGRNVQKPNKIQNDRITELEEWTRAAMGARPMAVALAPFETLTPGF